ncbi:MAG: TonB-dependent receptor, partial [Prevotella sp.]|nr:TonB-dependent receptor [Prevotella sp.]
MTYKNRFRITIILILMSAFVTATAQHRGGTFVYGRVLSADGSGPVNATVTLKPAGRGSAAGPDGTYRISAPAGRYTLVASALGYERAEHTVELRRGQRLRLDVRLRPAAVSLGEVSVVAGGVSRVKNSSYNAVAVDARAMRNTTKTLAEALAKAPGLKLRQSGGVGSDMNVMVDGFSGKHVKVFIDGVPQEGVGSSFGLNNIPVAFADRIEVYRGVVPVGLGADAIGGVINVVTRKDRRRWYADASYSYGSFNTHRSDLHFGQSTKGGLAYEVTAFQNYSDNDYCVDAPVYDFATHSINTRKLERVRRFNDTYHNEAVVAKVGFVGKPWADRLMLGFGYAHSYKDIQTGVRQKTVFGQKHRYGHSLMPSLEYSKRNAFVRGLNIVATANYNRNSTTNVDTAAYTYNWRGERERKGEGGEQSMLYARADADNWNATLTARYSPAAGHLLTFNEVFNAFRRDNTSLLYGHEETNPIAKQTRKNIVAAAYMYAPTERWNATAFAKHYLLWVAGPVATDANSSAFVRRSRSLGVWGYGAAASCLLARGLQAKLSYEKAYRLP